MKEKNNESLVKSFYYAFSGIKNCLVTERNLMIHFMIMIIVVISAFIFQITFGEWIACIILFGMVISLELVNTAIESVVDLNCKEFDLKAKKAKDTAAGAVLVSTIVAIVIGIIIFIPKIIAIFA